MFKNTMKTTVMLAGLGGLIILISGVIGHRVGLFFGLGIALVMVGSSYWFSDKLAIRSAGAEVIQREQAPAFYDLVASIAQRANLPMPRVAISPSDQPNAFATGRNPHHAVVCATQGLLRSMPLEEVEGVMAHEMMHVKHRDILIGSVAAAIATGISFIANMAMFAAVFGGRSRDDDGPNPLAILLLAIVAPIAAGLMQMAVSRSREFEADRGAAELLGSGRTLADALERIEGIAKVRPLKVAPQQAYAYIHNPLAEAPKRSGFNFGKLYSTHPDTEERIRRLRAM